MIAEVFFGISLALLIAGCAGTMILHKLPCKKSPLLSPVNCLMATVYLSVLSLIYPIHELEFGPEEVNIFKSLLISIHSSIRVFIMDFDYATIADFAQTMSPRLSEAYSGLGVVLFLLSPMLTFGVILSFFKNVTAYRKLFLSFRSDLYVFSKLNEKALTLASDIKRKNPRSRIVFTCVDDQEEGIASDLQEAARELNAICFKKDIVDINWDLGHASRSVYLFTIGENEAENVERSVKLKDRYHEKENFHLFIFASGAESEMLFSSVSGGMHIRRVNPIRTLIDHILYEDGAQIFESALDDGSSERLISVVLLGLGQHGTELLKALPWFCQMDGYRLEVHAFDKDPLALEKFTTQCPELMSPARNGTKEKGEAQYKITIYPGVDTNTLQFREKIQNIAHISCVFAALGDDSRNIRAAVTMRMLSERKGIHPLIQAIVYATSKKETLEGVTDYRGHCYDIRFIGDLTFTYSSAHIVDSQLYEEALQRHLRWGDAQDFWAYEFNFHSSIATAIHLKMRNACGMPWTGKTEAELTIEERDALERLEHRRWNAYMRSEGYIYSGSLSKESRNDLAKLHNNLVPYDALSDNIKRLDSIIGSE